MASRSLCCLPISRIKSHKAIDYVKLSVEEAEFRVLDILPGSREQQLQCVLRTVTLASQPEYGAISYVWGDASDTVQIRVGNRGFAATNSLHGILQVLRKPDERVTVWADAICIDQSNLDERKDQVGIMGSIYQQATRVHIWFGKFPEDWQNEVHNAHSVYETFCANFNKLHRPTIESFNREFYNGGPGPRHSESVLELRAGEPMQTAIDIMRLVAEGYEPLKFPFYDIETRAAVPNSPCKSTTNRECDGELSASLRPRVNGTWYEAVGALLWLVERPWWKRCWTLQEAVVPICEPTVHVGHHTLSLHTILQFWQELQKLANLTCYEEIIYTWLCGAKNSQLFWTLEKVFQLRSHFAQEISGTPEMVKVLMTIMARKSTLAHDRFYSTIGLLPSHCRTEADYTLSLSKLSCFAIIVLSVESLGDWPILACGIGIAGTPSWALNLRADNLFSGVILQTSQHLAASTASVEAQDLLKQRWDPRICLQAVRVAKITDRQDDQGQDANESYVEGNMLADFPGPWLASFLSFGESNSNARLWRTALLDACPKGFRGNDEYEVRLRPKWLEAFECRWDRFHQDCVFKRFAPLAILSVVWQPDLLRDQTKTTWEGYPPSELLSLSEVALFLESMNLFTFSTGARFFITDTGDMGHGRPTSEPGDEVFIVKGVNYPVVARKSGDSQSQGSPEYQFVSECYLDGWMYGETINDSTPWKEIVFV